MKKLESSKTVTGLYWDKFVEFATKRRRFKKNNKNKLDVNDTTSRIDGRENLTDDSTTPKSEES